MIICYIKLLICYDKLIKNTAAALIRYNFCNDSLKKNNYCFKKTLVVFERKLSEFTG